MKALFINPPVYDFSTFDLWNKPYGLLFIIDLFVKNGWDVFYFDFMDRNHRFYDGKKKEKKYGCGKYYHQVVDKPDIFKDVPRKYKRFGLPDEIFIEFIHKIGKVDCVLLTSGMTYWYIGVRQTIKICRNIIDAPIILGGTYASFCPDHAAKSGANLIFQGGDINKFVEFFNTHTDFSLSPVNNLAPYWRVYEYLSYLVVRTSFGCPFSCYYCGVKKIHPEYFLRNIDEVTYEICENVKRFSIQDVVFYDDALLYNFETGLEKILDSVRKNTCSINYHTPNGIHPRFISKYVAGFLKYSGFRTIRLSVESFDKKIQKQSSFKLFFSEFENAMKNLIDAGFSKQEIGAYILAGLPGQTIDDIIDTICILKQFPCKIKIAEYSPIPGTQDYEITRKIYPSLPLEEPLFQNNSIFPLWNFKDKWEKIKQIKQIAKDT